MARHRAVLVLDGLAGLVGSTVKITLEIEARVEAGTPENGVRTVTENSRTLKFATHGFRTNKRHYEHRRPELIHYLAARSLELSDAVAYLLRCIESRADARRQPACSG
jgi:hypothetical protein